MKAQYAILRFAKYKGPEIGHIESHNERTKEKYASNPDVDTSRSHLNFHLVTPQRKYRAEAEKQIAEAGCRTRSDSVRVVEALVTASPEFFKGKKKGEVKAYFQEALDFIQKHQSKDTIISAVVHMDEKTPHMHLSFVPLTADKRLSAKEIVGNKKKLTQWQDRFWEHMVKKYPDLERGESASETGRDHIPPRLFKEAVHLNRMKEQILKLMTDTNLLNKIFLIKNRKWKSWRHCWINMFRQQKLCGRSSESMIRHTKRFLMRTAHWKRNYKQQKIPARKGLRTD